MIKRHDFGKCAPCLCKEVQVGQCARHPTRPQPRQPHPHPIYCLPVAALSASQLVAVSLSGRAAVAGNGDLTVITSDHPEDENTFASPRRVREW